MKLVEGTLNIARRVCDDCKLREPGISIVGDMPWGTQKEILQKIFDHIPLMISFVEADGRIKLVNREWERALGWSLKEIREQNLDVFAEFYPDPQYRQEVLKFIAEAKGKWSDFKTRKRDGRVIDTAFVRIRLADGTSIGIGQDITERKQAEDLLTKEKEILEKIFDNIPVMIGFVGEDGRIKLVNSEWERSMGWTLKELQDQNVDIFAEAYPDATYRREILEFVSAATGESVDLKIRVRDGRVIDTACAVVHLSDGTKVAIAQDITERKRAEERIRATSKQLRKLSAKLQSAREEEGTRIARELHDELGSALTRLRWGLDEIDSTLSQTYAKSVANTLRLKIATMTSMVEGTLNTIRRISSELRPGILDEMGLLAAISWEARQFEARTGIICNFESSVENAPVSREQSIAIFRIFQEALTNILRHAAATRVSITIDSDEGKLVLTIRDDGRGITEQEKSEQHSLGILGMRERAHLIKGEIDIRGVDGKGTVIVVRVPVSEADALLKSP